MGPAGPSVDQAQHKRHIYHEHKEGKRGWSCSGPPRPAYLSLTLPLVAHSDLEADLMAMLGGIQMALEKGTHIWVESEAAQAVALINSASPGPAHSRHTLAHIRLLQSQCRIRASFSHTEGNKPANLLAKMSLEGSSRRCFGFGELPRTLKALIRSEQDGIPHIRTSARGRSGTTAQNHG